MKIVVPKQAFVINKPAETIVDFFFNALPLVDLIRSVDPSIDFVVIIFGSVSKTLFLSDPCDWGRVSGLRGWKGWIETSTPSGFLIVSLIFFYYFF